MDGPQAAQRGYYYGWTIALTSGVGLALSIATVVAATFSIFVAPLRAEFGWSAGQVFAAPLAVTLSSAFASPIVGAIVDRYGARRVVLISFVLEALILTSFYFQGDSILTFYLRYVALGTLAIGTTHVAFARVISLWFDRRRGLALGIALAGVGVGGIALPILCQALIANLGWQLAYASLALIILVLALLIVGTLLRDSPQQMGLLPDGEPARAQSVTADFGVTLDEARRTRFYWTMLLTFFAIGVSLQAMMLHLVPMLTERGVAASTAALAQSTIFAGMLCGRLVTGWLMDRYFAPRIALLFLLAPIVGIGALALGAGGGFAFVAAALIGLAAGAEVDVIAYLSSRYFGMRQFSRIYGTFYALYSLGGGVGPLLTARMHDASGGYVTALWMHVAILVVAVLVLTTFPRFPQWSAGGSAPR